MYKRIWLLDRNQSLHDKYEYLIEAKIYMSSIKVENVVKILIVLVVQRYDKQAKFKGKIHVACQKNF